MRWKPKLPEKKLKLFYTNGGELMRTDTLEEYIGVYFESNKAFFTYTDNGEGPRDYLVQILKDKDVILYSKFPNTLKPIYNPPLPKETIVFPEEKDYKKGYIDRHFAKKINDKNGVIKEINLKNKKLVNQLKQSKILYKMIEVRWKLTGPINDVNINKTYNPYAEPTQDEYGQDNSGIVYGVEDTNRRTVALKNKEMPGLKGKLINHIQFARISSYPPAT
jgi:hypothetical protein